MAWIERKSNYEVGDKTATTRIIGNFSGYFEVGTEVTIVGISERGYDIQDNEGHKIIECGWLL